MSPFIVRGGVGDEGEEGGGAEDEGGVDGRRGWGRADSHLRCLFASTWAAPRDDAATVKRMLELAQLWEP